MRSSLRRFASVVLFFMAAVLTPSASCAQESRKAMPPDTATSSPSETLLLLQKAEPQMELKLKEAGAVPGPHSASGLIWLLPDEAARRFRDLNPALVRDLLPALRLRLETTSPDTNVKDTVESLGGLVLESHGRFHEIAVPLLTLPQVRKLRGVVRVSKDLPVYPTQHR